MNKTHSDPWILANMRQVMISADQSSWTILILMKLGCYELKLHQLSNVIVRVQMLYYLCYTRPQCVGPVIIYVTVCYVCFYVSIFNLLSHFSDLFSSENKSEKAELGV